jgi:transketolase
MNQPNKILIEEIKIFEKIAKDIRIDILNMLYKAKESHIGSSFSIVDLLVALYFKYLSVSFDNPTDKKRDRFILSKGHGCPALYAVLKHKGFLNKHICNNFGCDAGTIGTHPARNPTNGIEASTGSLGHGLSIGTGMALAAKHDNLNYKTFVLMSDGEVQSGFIWEAALFAGNKKLDNLIGIVDYNKIQALGNVKDISDLEPLKDKWASFGWEATEIDGHSFSEICSAFEKLPFKKGKPSVIIAHTIKGKGISFMENKLLWHYTYPDKERYEKALKELE